MQQQLQMQESVFRKVDIQREKVLMGEIYGLVSESYGRMFLPSIAFQKERIKPALTLTKIKLQEMGVT